MAARVFIVFLCVLLITDFGATGNIIADNGGQCTAQLTVNLALQLQELSQQLQQQETRLQRQETHRAQQEIRLLQQELQLKEQSEELRSLRGRLQSVENSVKWNSLNWTAFNETQTTLDKAVQEHTGQLHGLQARVSSQDAALDRLTGNLTALVDASVRAKQGFRSVLSSEAVAANTPIQFQLEFTRGEGRYDASTGTYTASTPGIYHFGFQLFPQFFQDILFDLYVNGHIRIRSRCYDSAAYSTSCASSSVLHLQNGDRVWMQSNQAGNYYTGWHSFFSGALISPDL